MSCWKTPKIFFFSTFCGGAAAAGAGAGRALGSALCPRCLSGLLVLGLSEVPETVPEPRERKERALPAAAATDEGVGEGMSGTREAKEGMTLFPEGAEGAPPWPLRALVRSLTDAAAACALACAFACAAAALASSAAQVNGQGYGR